MNKIKTIIFILLFGIAANAQSSLICIYVPVTGRVTDQFGRGVVTNLHFRAVNGSPSITARTNSFGFFFIGNAVSCELYEVTPLNRKYQFTPGMVLMNPSETPFINFQAISEE